MLKVGVKRIVDTSFWTDGKVDEFSPEDKYFMLYLLTNPFSTQLGIYEISIKQVAFHLGYSIDTVKSLIERFEKTYGIIVFSDTTNEIAIKNFLRHSIIKGGKPVEDCIKKEMSKVKNKKLISKVFRHISEKDDLNDTVKKIISEFQNENHNDNEIQNDNDNDNEVSYPVSCYDSYDDSYPVSSKPKPKNPPKHKYGEFQKVRLTDEELQKLNDEYGESQIEEVITYFDKYIAEKGYKSQSHYLAIKRWVFDAVQEKKMKKKPQTNYREKLGNSTDDFMSQLQQMYNEGDEI